MLYSSTKFGRASGFSFQPIRRQSLEIIIKLLNEMKKVNITFHFNVLLSIGKLLGSLFILNIHGNLFSEHLNKMNCIYLLRNKILAYLWSRKITLTIYAAISNCTQNE